LKEFLIHHVDAGYPEAFEFAEQNDFRILMKNAREREENKL
jgi:hypothetical protein